MYRPTQSEISQAVSDLAAQREMSEGIGRMVREWSLKTWIMCLIATPWAPAILIGLLAAWIFGAEAGGMTAVVVAGIMYVLLLPILALWLLNQALRGGFGLIKLTFRGAGSAMGRIFRKSPGG